MKKIFKLGLVLVLIVAAFSLTACEVILEEVFGDKNFGNVTMTVSYDVPEELESNTLVTALLSGLSATMKFADGKGLTVIGSDFMTVYSETNEDGSVTTYTRLDLGTAPIYNSETITAEEVAADATNNIGFDFTEFNLESFELQGGYYVLKADAVESYKKFFAGLDNEFIEEALDFTIKFKIVAGKLGELIVDVTVPAAKLEVTVTAENITLGIKYVFTDYGKTVVEKPAWVNEQFPA